jgi:bacterioferritin-associated ferredoxin
MIICICHNISESQVKSAIQAGMNSLQSLRKNLAIGTCCGKCKPHTQAVLRECQSEQENQHVHTLHFRHPVWLT